MSFFAYDSLSERHLPTLGLSLLRNFFHLSIQVCFAAIGALLQCNLLKLVDCPFRSVPPRWDAQTVLFSAAMGRWAFTTNDIPGMLYLLGSFSEVFVTDPAGCGGDAPLTMGTHEVVWC